MDLSDMNSSITHHRGTEDTEGYVFSFSADPSGMGFAFHGTRRAEKEKDLALRRLFIKVIFCPIGISRSGKKRTISVPSVTLWLYSLSRHDPVCLQLLVQGPPGYA